MRRGWSGQGRDDTPQGPGTLLNMRLRRVGAPSHDGVADARRHSGGTPVGDCAQADSRRTDSVGRIAAAASSPPVCASSTRTISLLIRSRGCRIVVSRGVAAGAAGTPCARVCHESRGRRGSPPASPEENSTGDGPGRKGGRALADFPGAYAHSSVVRPFGTGQRPPSPGRGGVGRATVGTLRTRRSGTEADG